MKGGKMHISGFRPSMDFKREPSRMNKPHKDKKEEADFQAVLDEEIKKMESQPTKVSDSI